MQVGLRDVDRDHVGDLLGELEAARVDVGDDDVARPDMARDRPGHDADRPGPGDQHILADEIEGERGMDRIAERIEDRAELVVDVVGQRHDVERRHPHIFGEGAGDVDADAARLGIEMIAPAARRPALHPDHMALARHPLADLEAPDVGADRGDLARIFMAHVIGVGIVFRAHSSQLKMCTSVPQIPVLCTFTRTSSGPIVGAGCSSSQRPGSGFSLTRARMGAEQ